MRLIDADDLARYKTPLREPIRKPSSDDEVYAFRLGENDVIDAIMEYAPTVDAIPLRHGYWIRNDNGTYSCSECKSWIPNEQHYYARYCLFCGAKMDEQET